MLTYAWHIDKYYVLNDHFLSTDKKNVQRLVRKNKK